MTRKLLVVAASGLVLAILLLSAAWAIGGTQMMNAVHNGGWHFSDDDDDSHGATMTRRLAFDPSVPLVVDAPVDLHFLRGDHVAMTVSGEPRELAKLRWENGRLSLGDGQDFSHRSLDVSIVAPRLPPLTLAGAGDVEIKQLDQDELQLTLSGAGDFAADGQVRKVTVVNSGAGSVDLSKLAASDASATVSGLGGVDLAASGKVDVGISGAGSVTLHRRPAELTSRISGIGSVDQDY